MRLMLPDRFWSKVGSFPEHSYGVNLVTLVLVDGTRIHNVHLPWGREILAAKSNLSSDFDLSPIVDVESAV
jgi:hypothetical protein